MGTYDIVDNELEDLRTFKMELEKLKTLTEEHVMGLVGRLYNSDPEGFLLIEVGANDGYCCDRMWNFILKNDPNAVLVEPLPDYFEALKNNYKHLKNIKFENLAISDSVGETTMFYIPREEIVNENVRFRMDNTPHLWKEHWAGGLGSFYKDKNMLGDPNLKEFQKEVAVEVQTIDYILEKHDVASYKNIVMQTDCEGHDLVILNSFPFSKIEPKIYCTEIYGYTRYPESHPRYGKEVGMYSKEDEARARELFIENGYSLYRSNDMIAIKGKK